MVENNPGQHQDGEDPRIGRLGDRLSELDRKEQAGKKNGHSGDANQRLGNRVLSDLIAGVAGGLLFGWLFDRWFGTSPWLLFAFLTLGIIVAFRNIIKVSNAYSAELKANEAKMTEDRKD